MTSNEWWETVGSKRFESCSVPGIMIEFIKELTLMGWEAGYEEGRESGYSDGLNGVNY